MNTPSRTARLTGLAGVAALLALGGTAGAAYADATKVDDTNVDVNVTIDKVEQPGFLALSVASNKVDLQENGSDQTRRQFTGKLPTVTVTDTRAAGEVPADAAWSVLLDDFFRFPAWNPIPKRTSEIPAPRSAPD